MASEFVVYPVVYDNGRPKTTTGVLLVVRIGGRKKERRMKEREKVKEREGGVRE